MLSVVKDDTHSTCGEQPANDSPAWDDVRAEQLIGRMYDSTDVADEITTQGLTLWSRQILQQVIDSLKSTDTATSY